MITEYIQAALSKANYEIIDNEEPYTSLVAPSPTISSALIVDFRNGVKTVIANFLHLDCSGLCNRVLFPNCRVSSPIGYLRGTMK